MNEIISDIEAILKNTDTYGKQIENSPEESDKLTTDTLSFYHSTRGSMISDQYLFLHNNFVIDSSIHDKHATNYKRFLSSIESRREDYNKIINKDKWQDEEEKNAMNPVEIATIKDKMYLKRLEDEVKEAHLKDHQDKKRYQIISTMFKSASAKFKSCEKIWRSDDSFSIKRMKVLTRIKFYKQYLKRKLKFMSRRRPL